MTNKKKHMSTSWLWMRQLGQKSKERRNTKSQPCTGFLRSKPRQEKLFWRYEFFVSNISYIVTILIAWSWTYPFQYPSRALKKKVIATNEFQHLGESRNLLSRKHFLSLVLHPFGEHSRTLDTFGNLFLENCISESKKWILHLSSRGVWKVSKNAY